MKKLFIIAFILCSVLSSAQFSFSEVRIELGTSSQEADFLAGQKEALRMMEASSPALAKYEARLMEIQVEVMKISRKYQQGELTREEAEKRITLFLKEEIEIRNSIDYKIAQQLLMYLPPK